MSRKMGKAVEKTRRCTEVAVIPNKEGRSKSWGGGGAVGGGVSVLLICKERVNLVFGFFFWVRRYVNSCDLGREELVQKNY